MPKHIPRDELDKIKQDPHASDELSDLVEESQEENTLLGVGSALLDPDMPWSAKNIGLYDPEYPDAYTMADYLQKVEEYNSD